MDANIGRPQVAYRETIRKPSEKVRGQDSSGRPVVGVSTGMWSSTSSPPSPGVGFLFEDKIRGGSIPREYISSVEQGVKEALPDGVLAGYPVIDVKVELVDGSYHDVDSSEMAFKIAGSMALKEGVRRSKPVLLEPVMDVEVVTPVGLHG